MGTDGQGDSTPSVWMTLNGRGLRDDAVAMAGKHSAAMPLETRQSVIGGHEFAGLPQRMCACRSGSSGPRCGTVGGWEDSLGTIPTPRQKNCPSSLRGQTRERTGVKPKLGASARVGLNSQMRDFACMTIQPHTDMCGLDPPYDRVSHPALTPQEGTECSTRRRCQRSDSRAPNHHRRGC